MLFVVTTSHGQAADEVDARTYNTSSKSGGGILDWIAKLSGPKVERAGTFFSWQPKTWARRAHAPRFTITGYASRSVEPQDTVTPDSAELKVKSIQALMTIPAFLFPIRPVHVTIEGNVGLSSHWFTAKLSDAVKSDVQNWSFPIFGQVSVRYWRVVLNYGEGWHLFLPFEQTDFEEVPVTVERDNAEFVRYRFLSVEYQF
jgi:hypothetical protein